MNLVEPEAIAKALEPMAKRLPGEIAAAVSPLLDQASAEGKAMLARLHGAKIKVSPIEVTIELAPVEGKAVLS